MDSKLIESFLKNNAFNQNAPLKLWSLFPTNPEIIIKEVLRKYLTWWHSSILGSKTTA